VVYIFGIILAAYFIMWIYDEIQWEIKNKTLFKKKRGIYTGRTAYDFAIPEGTEYKGWGCGTWAIVIIVGFVILWIVIYPR